MTEEYRVRATGIRDRLSDEVVSLMDCHLVEPLADLTELKILSIVVPMADGKSPAQHDINKFGDLIAYLIKEDLVGHKVLADPLWIPLQDCKADMIWYSSSDYTKDELNKKLGCECFVDEGGLYRGDWPEVVR